MMWLARLKPLVAVAAALILATVGVAVHGRQQPAPEGARDQAKTAPPPTAGAGGVAVSDTAANRALAREQLALIDGALADEGLSTWGNSRPCSSDRLTVSCPPRLCYLALRSLGSPEQPPSPNGSLSAETPMGGSLARSIKSMRQTRGN